MVMDGMVGIVFVKTEENCSDGLTKNVNAEVYAGHSATQVVHKEVVHAIE